MEICLYGKYNDLRYFLSALYERFYFDEYHVEVGRNLYHICEFAERMEQNGHSYEPKLTE